MKNKILSFFTRDVNEFNKLLLSILSVAFLVVVGFISYEASDSFAIFTDDTDGDTTIQIDANIAPNKPILSSNMIAVYYDETCDIMLVVGKRLMKVILMVSINGMIMMRRCGLIVLL